MKDCNDARIAARGAGRAESDRRHHACMGNRECLADAKAAWEAEKKRIDEQSAACSERVRRIEASQPPPWAGWKPGDPPPRAKDGRYYLMSCSGKVLGLYKPGGALAMEVKLQGGSCVRAETWGELKLNPEAQRQYGFCPEGGHGRVADGCRFGSPQPEPPRPPTR